MYDKIVTGKLKEKTKFGHNFLHEFQNKRDLV